MLTWLILTLSICSISMTFRIQDSGRDLDSHFVSDNDLQEVAAGLQTGLEANDVEMVDLQESIDLDSGLLTLKSDKKNVTLRIVPTANFISPSAVLRIIDEDSEYEEEIDPLLMSSFYHGYVDDEHKGPVSLVRTKRGWTGSIQKNNHRHIIHKVPESQSSYLLVKTKPKGLTEIDNNIIGRKPRLSRGVKNEFELEVGAYADKKLLEKIQQKFPRENAKSKVLEIMLISIHTAHVNYQRPSVGNKISIIASHLSIWKAGRSPSGNLIEGHSYSDEFCKWNHERNYLGRLYDVGVVFTGYEMYQGTPDDTGVVGLAHLGGTCKFEKPRSCLIVQTDSYNAGHIFTHELGHNLGMNHDGFGNSCPNGQGVMGNAATDFSRCSRDYLQKYLLQLDEFGVNCLRTRTTWNNKDSSNSLLPGERVPKGEQCKLILGEGYTENTNFANFCEKIGCSYGSYSTQSFEAPLPGTPCGRDKVCWATKCQSKNQVDMEIANSRPTKSKSTRRKLSLDELCKKYAPSYPTGLDYNNKEYYRVNADLSRICDFEMICYSPHYRQTYNFWEPAPEGTTCAPGKKMQRFQMSITSQSLTLASHA